MARAALIENRGDDFKKHSAEAYRIAEDLHENERTLLLNDLASLTASR
jgi:hypothetical protein